MFIDDNNNFVIVEIIHNCFLFPRYNKEGTAIGTEVSGFRLMVVTLKLLRDPRLLLLLPLTTWMGVEQVFRGADYTSVSILHSVFVIFRRHTSSH
jgi:hypothetical protein